MGSKREGKIVNTPNSKRNNEWLSKRLNVVLPNIVEQEIRNNSCRKQDIFSLVELTCRYDENPFRLFMASQDLNVTVASLYLMKQHNTRKSEYELDLGN